jgi:hypothetical protein
VRIVVSYEIAGRWQRVVIILPTAVQLVALALTLIALALRPVRRLPVTSDSMEQCMRRLESEEP